MSKPSSIADVKVLARAAVTNQIARFAPKAYLKLTAQTGRGAEDESVSSIAEYFRRCFDDYRTQLAAQARPIESLIDGQHLLEYGPGDLPGEPASGLNPAVIGYLVSADDCTGQANSEDVDRVRDCLIERFAGLPAEDLQLLSFWVIVEKPGIRQKPSWVRSAYGWTAVSPVVELFALLDPRHLHGLENLLSGVRGIIVEIRQRQDPLTQIDEVDPLGIDLGVGLIQLDGYIQDVGPFQAHRCSSD